MTAHEWFVEQRADYAIRSLDEGDRATFDAHLPNCPECRAEIDRVEAELAWLPMGLKPVAPRPGFSRRVIQEVLDEPRRPARRWLMPAALAASLLLALGAWLAGRQQSRSLEAELAALQGRTAALEDTLSIMKGAARVLQANVRMGGQQGGLVIFANEDTHRWNVVVHGLPPAPAGERYQFWFITADGMVRGSEVRLDPKGHTMFTTGMPPVGGTVMGAALTLEPGGVSSGPPRGPTLAHLML
ncbi:MAG: anti-sigma factor [Gemmatimonadales bacterium]|nr:anti-sigma factor [Gemmatimonadales bacterium]